MTPPSTPLRLPTTPPNETSSTTMPHIHDTPPPQSSTSTTEDEKSQRIRIKNRRKLYLDRHPSYFTAPDLELADPLLYDRCIRRFQTPAEREADGKKKGYSGVLEADLWRSEAKLAALNPHSQPESSSSSKSLSGQHDPTTYVSYARGPNGEVLPESDDEIPKSREEGEERWKFEMTLRFLRGEDEEFEYAGLDESEEFDAVERRECEERWFDEEEPSEVGAEGETGVQDF